MAARRRDAPDESTIMDMEVALKDDFRCLNIFLCVCYTITRLLWLPLLRRVAFYNSYISEMRRAMVDHANIAGYFAWSLLDNFE